MARSSTAPTTKSKSKQATTNSARDGYAKRHAKRAKPSADDVYEYSTDSRKLSRRAKVGLELDHDEELGGDVPDDEEERNRLRARLIGENEDNEMIDSEDDEDLDSDAAFDDSDDDRFAGFFSSKPVKSKGKEKAKAKSSVRFADVDLNEDDDVEMPEAGPSDDGNSDDEEEEESGEDDEFIDVLDILDGRGEPMDDDADKPQKPSSSKLASDNEEDDEDDDDDEEVEEDPFSPDEDEESPDALENLHSFVSSLPTASLKRKPDAEADAAEPPRKRRILKEKHEAGAENEYRPHSAGTKLALDDLLAPLASQPETLQALKQSTKPLKSTRIQTLNAPLQYRAQERLDREAAYEQTKTEVDKWSATMKRIQEAEHLSFPLQSKPEGRVSALELTAKFRPRTELESSVDKLLKSAKLRDEDIEATEEDMLKTNKLTVEEVAERRAELRRNRELMFRAETKAKRVAKIKSKTYRKLKRKEREKLEEQNESDEEDALKREVERAKERATLRHKNTGKWAKQMKGRNEFEEDGSRQNIEEMLTKGESLKRKIAGKGSDDESDESDDEGGFDEEAIRQEAFQELSRLREAQTDDGESGKGKGVFEMKFMKDAMARKQNEADKEVDDFVKEMNGIETIENGDDADPSSGVVVSRTGGRAVYHPGAAKETPKASTSKISVAAADPTDQSNPWLNPEASSSTKLSRRKNEVVVDKDSNLNDKAKNKLKKKKAKVHEEKAKAQDDARVEIDVDNVLNLGSKGKEKQTADGEDEDEDEVDLQERKLVAKKGKGKNVAFEQRDLVAMAFAGDNVVQEFQETKRREMDADAPTEVDTTLPGWGSWGGTGASKPKPKPHLIKKIAGIDPKSRKDYGKGHVIISEKVDKKAAKYLVKDLPYPYTSKAQYERSLEQPIGVEWNTRVGFQRATMPKVTKKLGAVIDPLSKVF